MAIGAVRIWISQPEIPNPRNSAAALVPVRVEFASTSRSRPMTVGR